MQRYNRNTTLAIAEILFYAKMLFFLTQVKGLCA